MLGLTGPDQHVWIKVRGRKVRVDQGPNRYERVGQSAGARDDTNHGLDSIFYFEALRFATTG